MRRVPPFDRRSIDDHAQLRWVITVALRDEIIEALHTHGPLDDDRLGLLLSRNRHYVNQVCRYLVRDGCARRLDGPDGKLVTELVEGLAAGGTTVIEARSSRRPSSVKRLRRHQLAERNATALVESFDECVRQFESRIVFTGPSIYFHDRAIERRRHATSIDELLTDERSLEYVYAVLPAWGMHRMGRQAAKVGAFDAMTASLVTQRDKLAELYDTRISAIPKTQREMFAERLWDIIAHLKVSTSGTRIVAGTKALHHVLPDLVPPIDRRYTIRFLTGQTSLHFGEQPAFYEWFPILCDIAEKAAPALRRALARRGPMASGEAKVLDNAIIGFMLRAQTVE